MEERHCDVKVVRTPFRATGIQLLPSHTAPVQRSVGLAVGSRGVRQLASQKSNATGVAAAAAASLTSGELAPGAAPSVTNQASPSRILTLHHDGHLLIWDCVHNALIASCEHGAGLAVAQCLSTADHLFVRLQSAPGSEGVEDDSHVHVWSAQSFQRAFTLRGHESRITAMAICGDDPGLLATASLDRTVRVWNVGQDTAQPVQTLSLETCGIVCGLEFLGRDVLVAAGSSAPVTVWHWPTRVVLAAAPVDGARAATVMRIFAVPPKAGHISKEGHGGTREPVSSTYAVFVGCTDGFIVERTLQLSASPCDASLAFCWQAKPHTATVESVHVDGDVVASCSMYDGAYVVNKSTGVSRLLGPKTPSGATASIGCTALTIDTANKRVLVGAHTGEVCVWNYAQFATGSSKEVQLVASFRPHRSAITGLCLELTSGNVWERFLACSGDGDVCVLDYRGAVRSAVTLPSASNGAVLTRLKLDCADGPRRTIAFVPLSSDAVTDAALAVVDEKTLQPLGDGSRGLALGKSVVAVTWLDAASELLVATTDGAILAMAFQAGTGWRKTRQWPVKSEYTVSAFAENTSTDSIVVLGLVSRRGEGGAVAVIALQKEPSAAVSYLATPNNEPQYLVVVANKQDVRGGAAIVVEMKNGVAQVFKWLPTASSASSMVQAGPILSPPRATASTALARNRRSHTVCVIDDVHSASGTATVLVPSEKGLVARRCSPNGTADELANLSFLGTNNVVSATAVNQGGIGLAVCCEHTSQVSLCDKTGAVLYVVFDTGAVVAAAQVNQRTPRAVSYPGSTEGHGAHAKAPYCVAISFEPDRRYIALAYDNGLVQLVDTSEKYVFARLWGPQGPFSTATVTGIVATRNFIFVMTEQCPLTALAVPHRALMDAPA